MITELKSAVTTAPSRRARLKNLSRVESVKLKVERSALLFRGAPTAIIISVVNALITGFIAWQSVSHGVLLPWVGAVIALAAIRGGVWLRFYFARASGRAMSRFAKLHVLFMAINGALWGAVAPIFAVYGLLSHAFLPFVVAGMAAAAVISAGASWRSVLAFNLPLLAPTAATYALAWGENGFAISTIVILFGGATTYLALSIQKMIDRSILLHTHNTRLFDAIQKQADEAHVAEQRFRALVEASHDVTIIFSPDGRVTYASPSVQTIFDASPEQFIGKTTKEIVHADDLSQFRAVGEKSLSKLGEVVQLDHVCMTSDASEYKMLAGRLTNMLYVPGVEGFVFNGGLLKEEPHQHLHAVP